MSASGIVGYDLERALETIHEVNPELGLYSVNGQFVFPVYAVSGGISLRKVVYIVRPSYWDAQNNRFVMPCFALDYDHNAATLVQAAAKFDLICKLINPDGGDMGYPVKL